MSAAAVDEDPGFELGEDAPRNASARQAQEARWAKAKVDARQHLSVREALLKHRSVLGASIDDYVTCVVCSSALSQAMLPAGTQDNEADTISKHRRQTLGSLGQDLLGLVLEFALCAPDQGELFRSLSGRRIAGVGHKYVPGCPFKICVRKRPLTESERESKDFDVVETFNGSVAGIPKIGTLA